MNPMVCKRTSLDQYTDCQRQKKPESIEFAT